MNRKERNHLIDLYDLADKVPLPHDGMGAKSASMQGAIDYSADMREFVPAFKSALYGLACSAAKNSDLIKGEDYEDPDVIVPALRAWVEERNQKQWERPTLYWHHFYTAWKESLNQR